MSANEPSEEKPSRSFDSAFGFSFAVAIGLILFIGGLVITLTVGGGSTSGLIFGIPLLFAGMIVPLIMMRSLFHKNEISGPCPYCSEKITTSDATLMLECPNCKKVVAVRDEELHATKTPNPR
ncbi:MAG TPA: hypothetical protein VLL54_17495 [Pyrinomonadaceae bacterium]|nr:hypothetical protein [Pyrinomonadaceae bacterium]